MITFTFGITHEPLRSSCHGCIEKTEHGYGTAYDIVYSEVGGSQAV